MTPPPPPNECSLNALYLKISFKLSLYNLNALPQVPVGAKIQTLNCTFQSEPRRVQGHWDDQREVGVSEAWGGQVPGVRQQVLDSQHRGGQDQRPHTQLRSALLAPTVAQEVTLSVCLCVHDVCEYLLHLILMFLMSSKAQQRALQNHSQSIAFTFSYCRSL